jgi:AcrR family transcriptional regulator
VSDCTSSRSQKKAQTRARIVNAAQQLFAASGFEAVTITEIAAAAEVSVQTVFNHVASKEELFFAERAAWVEGPAEAIRTRPPGARLTDVLQRHFVRTVEGYARAATTDVRHRRMIEVLDSSPALLVYERSLHEDAIGRLGAALAEAWECVDDDPSGACRPVLADVTASVWMAAVRSIVMGMRSDPPAIGDDAVVAATVRLTDRVLGDLAGSLSFAEAAAVGSTYRVA